MIVKEKRDSTIKRRSVAVGNKQRNFITKEYSSSPTVSTEVFLLSCIIYVEEKRDSFVIDTPNAFIQKRVENENEMAAINIKGVLVDLLL